MVNATILHLKHSFQASSRPCSILGEAVGWGNGEMRTVQSGRRVLSPSRLLFLYPLAQLGASKSLPDREGGNAVCPWRELLLHLAHALDQLEETTIKPECCVSYAHDAAIQRFEFCIELFLEIFRKIGGIKGKAPESQPMVFG